MSIAELKRQIWQLLDDSKDEGILIQIKSILENQLEDETGWEGIPEAYKAEILKRSAQIDLHGNAGFTPHDEVMKNLKYPPKRFSKNES
ncbi:MAG: hypothetical protein H6581_07120 [Bacteroidia bacterium]|nr:hypothetical protein [Bacteroidia bacterium]